MQQKLRFTAFIIVGCAMLLITSCKKDTVTPTPIVVSFAPTNGTQGTPVTIVGTNFSATPANNTVKFNGIAAVVTASTETTITATVPAGATSGTVSVEVSGKSATSTSNFRVDLLFKATMTGASEVPANTSTGTGLATLIYNKDTKIFTVVVTYTGIQPNNGHIHKGAVGVSGPVIYPFTTPGTSPITYTSAALTADQEADLIGGLNYVNLHTVALPAGEIRGQLLKP